MQQAFRSLDDMLKNEKSMFQCKCTNVPSECWPCLLARSSSCCIRMYSILRLESSSIAIASWCNFLSRDDEPLPDVYLAIMLSAPCFTYMLENNRFMNTNNTDFTKQAQLQNVCVGSKLPLFQNNTLKMTRGNFLKYFSRSCVAYFNAVSLVR